SSLKVIAFLSALQLQDLARSGTIVSGLFCGLLWSNSTRLFITGIIGIIVELVAVSWIESVGGLSRGYIFRTPPLFCAEAAVEQARAAIRPPRKIIGRIVRFPPSGAACRFCRSISANSVEQAGRSCRSLPSMAPCRRSHDRRPHGAGNGSDRSRG